MQAKYRRVKYACYMTNASMSVVGNLSPPPVLTFRQLYGISFSLLGTLVLINFSTQLLIDLLFSFYSHRFNMEKTVRITPLFTVAGLLVYALFPFFFPNAVYLGLVLGTILFASSGGLSEVLISPVIAEIPSEHPEREMSKLHSIYAWGVVGMVVISTLFLFLFGGQNWQWLALLWTLVPLSASLLFVGAPIPALKTLESAGAVLPLLRSKDFLVCFFCIFMGGASECTMAQWSSGYLEKALSLPKIYGDLFGVALFAAMLGAGRTLFAKYGKNVYPVLIAGSAGATLCYLAAAVSNSPFVGLIACALTGLCTAMLWPGSLLVVSDRFPNPSVALFALMAAGGDLGGSVGPQLVGMIADFAIGSENLNALSQSLGLSAEQLGMKAGLTFSVVFPLFATLLFYRAWKRKKMASVTASSGD